MSCNLVKRLCFIMLLSASFSYGSESALDSVKKIVGTYTGNWTMYGIESGIIVEKAAWTDVLTAGNPKLGNGRAYVDVSDVMTFQDGSVRTSNFLEGYLENSDKTAGERFYEIHGNIMKFKKLTDNDWTYHSVPDLGELWFLGFTSPQNVISSSHVTTKSTTYEGVIDTDHVTRVTTVQWSGDDGSIKSIQFVSMKGEHRRNPTPVNK